MLRRARGGKAATLLSGVNERSWKRARWWLRHPRARGSGLRERSAFAPAFRAPRGPKVETPLVERHGARLYRFRRENAKSATAPTATRYASAQMRIVHPCTYAPPNGPSWSRKPVSPLVFAVIIRSASW